MVHVEEKIRRPWARGAILAALRRPRSQGRPGLRDLEDRIEREVPDPGRRGFLDSFERFRHEG
jgi:hypothetical protein